jgi:hypothetical protein
MTAGVVVGATGALVFMVTFAVGEPQAARPTASTAPAIGAAMLHGLARAIALLLSDPCPNPRE